MYERIVVGTDGPATAAGAPDRAVDVAQALGSTLTVRNGTPGRGSRSAPSRFLVGSVPNRVSHHAPVAVLISRTA